VAQSAKLIKREYSLTLSVCEIVKGIDDTVMDFYLKKARLKPGTEEFLKKLKERGIALSVATVTGRECTEAALRRTGIYGLFTAVLTADDAPCGKERPDIFLLAARAMGTEPGNTLVFEDALHAVETAHAAGFVTVGVYDSFSEAAQPRLKEAADHYIRDFCGFDSFARGAGI
jgi:HAD superfamily hydrolase (TIGR01509 family)